MLKIGEDNEYIWYCTLGDGCKCLSDYPESVPALEDCIACGLLLFQCKICGKFVSPDSIKKHIR